MIIPPVMRCDFCTNQIALGTHYATLKVPIPPSLRSEMVAYVEQDILPRVRQSPLGHMLDGAEGLVPHTWKLEVCIDCAYGIVPGIREMVATQIRESIMQGIDAKRRGVESLESLEPDPKGVRR